MLRLEQRKKITELLKKLRREVGFLLVPFLTLVCLLLYLRMKDLEQSYKEQNEQKNLVKSEFVAYKALQTNDLSLRFQIVKEALKRYPDGTEARKVLFETLTEQQFFYRYRVPREKNFFFDKSKANLFIQGKNSYLLDFWGTVTGNPSLPLNTKAVALTEDGARLILTGDGRVATAEKIPKILEWENKKMNFRKIFVSPTGKIIGLQGENFVVIADKNLKQLDKIQTRNRFPELVIDSEGSKWAILKGLRLWQVGFLNSAQNSDVWADKLIFEKDKKKWFRLYAGKIYADSLLSEKDKQPRSRLIAKNVEEFFLMKGDVIYKHKKGAWKSGATGKILNLPAFFRHVTACDDKVAFTHSGRLLSVYDSNFHWQGNINTESEISESPEFDFRGENLFVPEKRFLSLYSLKNLNFTSKMCVFTLNDRQRIVFGEGKLLYEDNQDFTFFNNVVKIETAELVTDNVFALRNDNLCYLLFLREKKLKKLNLSGKILGIKQGKIVVLSSGKARVYDLSEKLLFECAADSVIFGSEVFLTLGEQQAAVYDFNFNKLTEIKGDYQTLAVGRKTYCATTDSLHFTWFDEKGDIIGNFETQIKSVPLIAPEDDKILFKKITSKGTSHTYYGIEGFYNRSGSRILLEREPLRPRLTAIYFHPKGKYLVTESASRAEFWDEDAFRIYSVEGEKVILDERRKLFITKSGNDVKIRSLSGKILTDFTRKGIKNIRYDEKSGIIEVESEEIFFYIHCDLQRIFDWATENITDLSNEDKKSFIGEW
jgi:hypothetical protein